MKRAVMLAVACIFFIGYAAVGYCQDESGSEESMESSIEQNLESEISNDQAENERDMGQMEESMDTGGATNY